MRGFWFVNDTVQALIAFELLAKHGKLIEHNFVEIQIERTPHLKYNITVVYDLIFYVVNAGDICSLTSKNMSYQEYMI